MNKRFPSFENFYFWSAYLTLECTHSCPYCIQGYGLDTRARLPRYEHASAQEWIAGLNAITPKPRSIVLQGGEPTLHPGCFDIIEALEGYQEIHLYSNLHFDMDRLTSTVRQNLPRLKVYVSFHPSGEKDVARFQDRLRELIALGDGILARNIIVESPQNLPLIPGLVESFLNRNLPLDRLEYQGIVNGKLMPEGYEEGFGLHSRKKVWCRCKQVNIAPNGNVYNCATRVYRDSPVHYGNLFDSKDLAFPAGFIKCNDYGFCNPCTITRTHAFPQTITVDNKERGMFGTAIIGCGYMANWHVNGWSSIPEAKILAVVDPDQERAGQIAAKCQADIVSSHRELFDRQDIQAVSVTLPHHVRADVVCELLDHGLHVLLEKPAALSVEEARRMHDSAVKNGKIVMVAENWRYNPVTIEASRLIASGAIGDPFMIYAHMEFMENFRPHQMPWHKDPEKSGGGVVIDSGVHVLSILRMLGGEVSATFGLPGKQVWQELLPCEDNYSMLFKFANGATGSASLAWRGKRKNFHSAFTVLGSDGILEFNFQGGINPIHVITLTAGQDVKEIEVPSSPSMGIQEQTRHFVDCITQGKQADTSLSEEMKSVQLALCLYESAKTGQWVDVPPLGF